jgi:hypothetical protein
MLGATAVVATVAEALENRLAQAHEISLPPRTRCLPLLFTMYRQLIETKLIPR